MKRSDLEKYYSKRIKRILQDLKTPVSKRTPETFHSLRIEIKKVKAVFALIDSADKKFKQNKSFEPFRKLFKKAGEVRALQLEEKFLIQYCKKFDAVQLISDKRKKQKIAIADFGKETKKKSVKEIEHTEMELKSFLNRVKEKHLRDYNNHVWHKMKDLRKKEFNPANLHEIRKQLKEFLYNLKLSYPESNKRIKAIDSLQDLIGKWHDNDIASMHLAKAIHLKKSDKAEIKKVIAVLKRVAVENERLLKRINRKRRI